jgi:hypothetical protein
MEGRTTLILTGECTMPDSKPGTLVYWKRFWSTASSEGPYYGKVHYYTGGNRVLCGERVPQDEYIVDTRRTAPTCKRCLKALAARNV